MDSWQKLSAFSSSHEFSNTQSASQSAFHTACAALRHRLMESYLMSSHSTRHYQTASSSSHCCFTFLDGNQGCAVIKIWFCAASPGKQVWFQEERKQPHSIWHTRVITGGRALGHLYLVWGGGEVQPGHLGSILSPWRVQSQVCVSPALAITDCEATFTLPVED